MESLISCRVCASMTRTLPFLLLPHVLLEVLHVKVFPGIRPALPAAPAGRGREIGESCRGVFVAMLGDNGLITRKCKPFSGDQNALVTAADEAHLDPVRFGNPDRLVTEGSQ